MALYADIEKRLGAFHLKVRLEAEDHVLALLGASGSGKSMTLKCIAGIETPDRGRIVLDGVTLFDSERRINLAPQKRRVGYLFQQYALFPNMTVAQNIACGVRGGGKKDARVREMLAAMRLDDAANKKPYQISGGQQQRVALARILVNEPDVMLLDEPFSALDSHLRFQLEGEVRSAIRRFGKTVLLVSHNRDEVYRLSDRIAIMRAGRIETVGEKAAVFADPKTRSGAILTGCKNVARLEKRGERLAYVPDWGMTLHTGADIGEVASIGIRMHDIHPAREGRNVQRCAVVEVIENPFSLTVMLRPIDAPQAVPIGWEVEKGAWTGADEVSVCLPPENILLLRE